MKYHKFFAWIIILIVFSISVSVFQIESIDAQKIQNIRNDTSVLPGNQTLASGTTYTPPLVVRDTVAILLEDKTVPANGFVHLYDTIPYMIARGHVAANLPCDITGKTEIKLLIGQEHINLKPVDLHYIKESSTPGKVCMYHTNIESSLDKIKGIITDVAIQNPTSIDIKLGPGSSIVVGVDEIRPGAEQILAMSNMIITNNTANNK